MIAKGLDFPNVTLVGVINADTALHLPDFRAAERTFQLVTQVAGRTGRGDKGGRVLVQTFSPEHPAIRGGGAARLRGASPPANCRVREMLHYPPFAAMIRLVVRGRPEPPAQAFAAADRPGSFARPGVPRAGSQARVLGRRRRRSANLRGKYRFQMQIQGPDGDSLRQAVAQATAGLKPPDDVQWIVDVDPLDML